MKVRQVPKGTLKIPMPPLVQGTQGPKLQGGLPPQPYRSTASKWLASKQIRREVLCDRGRYTNQ
jgi:hypothetical protein